MENDGRSQDQKRTKIDANDIPDVLEKFKDKKESKKSKLVSIDELKENEYNLSVRRYIDNSVPEEEIDLQNTLDELKKIRKEREKLEKAVDTDLKELGLKV
jgi:type I restriction enzyme M protein